MFEIFYLNKSTNTVNKIDVETFKNVINDENNFFG